MLDERDGADGQEDAGERLLALLEGDPSEVEAVEVEQVEGHVGHGDAVLGGGDVELTAEVHALLEELEGGHATPIEGDNLAVEDGLGHGLRGQGGDESRVRSGEVGAAT